MVRGPHDVSRAQQAGVGMQNPVPRRVEERLALHELIRVGLGRQEDLRLLQSVTMQHLAVAGVEQQLLRECRLREEWRCMRESQLLQRTSAMDVTLLTDAEDQDLTNKLMELQQMQSDQRQVHMQAPRGLRIRRIHGGAAPVQSPPTSTAPGTPLRLSRATTSAPSSPYRKPASSLPAALQLYGGGGSSRPGTSSSVSVSRKQQLPSSGGLTDMQSLRRSNSAARLAPAQGLDRQVPPASPVSRALVRQPSSGSLAPPSPRHSPAGGGSGGSGGGTLRSSSPSMPPAAPRQQQEPAAVAGAGGGGRFQQLYRLQGTLMQGLHAHASADGPRAALDALQHSVAGMQAYFAQCVEEVVACLQSSQQEQDPLQWRPGTAPAARLRDWSRLLGLGQLGLTSADVARLQHLRCCQAARTIQRKVRAFLKRRRHERAVEAARKRAANMQQKLRHRAAVTIQRHWRGHAARRLTARLRQQHQQQRREARAQRLRLELSAIRIQRAYREHRKRVKARRALGGHGATATAAAAAAPGLKEQQGSAGRQQQQTSVVSAGAPEQRSPALDQAAASCSHRPGAAHSSSYMDHGSYDSSRAERAAVVIQAHARGWLVRRSRALWWRQQLGRAHERRSAVRAWRSHQQFMQDSYGLQEKLLESVVVEAELGARCAREMAAERAEFETAWSAWLGQQFQLAMSTPLPKGWIPHPDTASGELRFLNTRTGELHAHHPAILQLQAFAQQQRQQGEAAQAERQARVAAYVDEVHASSLRAQGHLLAMMHVVMSRQIRAGVGAGDGGRQQQQQQFGGPGQEQQPVLSPNR